MGSKAKTRKGWLSEPPPALRLEVGRLTVASWSTADTPGTVAMCAASFARLTAGTAFAAAGDGSSALTTVARRGRAASVGIGAEDRTWYVTVSLPPAANDPAFTPAVKGFSPLMSAIGPLFRVVELGTYETCDGMTSLTTRLVAPRSDVLLTTIV